MENQFCYIGNEPFYIRAEKILERKFSDSNKSVIFQLCSIIRGFFILPVVSKYRRCTDTGLAISVGEVLEMVLATMGITSRFGGALVWHLRFGFLFQKSICS